MSAAEAAAITNQFRLGNWSGGVYAKDQSKAFDRCAATTSGEKGAALSYSINDRFQWTIRLSSPAWSFIKGASLNVALRIGDAPNSMAASAVATDQSILEIQARDPIATFAKLRVARQLKVIVGGVGLAFAVEGGDRVLSTLTQCALRATRFRQNANSGKSILDSRDSSSSYEEAAALVSNIISYTRVAGSAALPSGESPPGMAIDAAWKAGSVTGGITVLQTETPVERIPDALIEHWLRTCRGESFFVSWSDAIDQSPIARVLLTCQTPEETTALYRLAVPRPKGGFYIVSVVSTGSAFSAMVQKAADEYEEKIRAVIMVAIRKLD